MERLAELPDDMMFFTQITMEAAEDPEFLDAMRKAHIRGALVGVESVTTEGLKAIYKDFNLAGDALVERLKSVPRAWRACAGVVHLRPADATGPRPSTRRRRWRRRRTSRSRSSCCCTPFPGTVDFEKWEKAPGRAPPRIDNVPMTRHWLLPASRSGRRSTRRIQR